MAMEDISDFFSRTFPAAVGGLLAIKWKKREPGKSDWRNAIESMAFAIGGYSFSTYLVPILEIRNQKVEQAALFGVGLIGMNIVNELYDEVMPLITGWIKKKINNILKY
jgi:hypothetical protein